MTRRRPWSEEGRGPSSRARSLIETADDDDPSPDQARVVWAGVAHALAAPVPGAPSTPLTTTPPALAPATGLAATPAGLPTALPATGPAALPVATSGAVGGGLFKLGALAGSGLFKATVVGVSAAAIVSAAALAGPFAPSPRAPAAAPSALVSAAPNEGSLGLGRGSREGTEVAMSPRQDDAMPRATPEKGAVLPLGQPATSVPENRVAPRPVQGAENQVPPAAPVLASPAAAAARSRAEVAGDRGATTTGHAVVATEGRPASAGAASGTRASPTDAPNVDASPGGEAIDAAGGTAALGQVARAGGPAPSATAPSAGAPASTAAPHDAGGGDAAPSTRAGALREESALVARARAAVRGGDAGGALVQIAELRRRFPRGALGQECDTLEIAALAAAGRRDEARQRALRFLRAHPESPLAPQVAAFAH